MFRKKRIVNLVLSIFAAGIVIGISGCAQPQTEIKYVDKYIDKYVEAIIKDGSYDVYHYQQNTTGGNFFENYTLKQSEKNKMLSAGTKLEDIQKTYVGFTAKSLAQNGSTIYVLYDRNVITYTFNSGEGKFTDGQTSKTVSGLYGANYINPINPGLESKIFSSWQDAAGNVSPLVFGEKDETFTATYFDIGGLTIYKFHETPVAMSAGTDGTAGISATYVEFGDWPQTVLPESSSVAVDETKKIIMGANTYYLGTDGNYYAKCKENAYATGYKYSDNNPVKKSTENSYRYFKVEPIKWCVLTDNYSGKKLLLAENILTADIPFYEGWSGTRSVGADTTIYPNNYKYSQIRAYLNGLSYYNNSNAAVNTYSGNGFLQSAFTGSAQTLIADTEVDNSPSTTGYSEATYATDYACENTTDKIFLLSVSEVINTAYGFNSERYYSDDARKRYATDYAKANYVEIQTDAKYGDCWLLRSPDYMYNNYANYVDYYGPVMSNISVPISCYGVVPALTISF